MPCFGGKAYKAVLRFFCMMKSNLSEGIRELSAGLQRLEAHLAWLSLKEQEWKPGLPPVLLMNPDLAAAIRNESSHFVAMLTEMRQRLDDLAQHRVQEQQCKRWRREVAGLERAFHGLDLPKSF